MNQIEANYKSNSNSHTNPDNSPTPLSPEQQTKKEEQDDFIEINI